MENKKRRLGDIEKQGRIFSIQSSQEEELNE